MLNTVIVIDTKLSNQKTKNRIGAAIMNTWAGGEVFLKFITSFINVFYIFARGEGNQNIEKEKTTFVNSPLKLYIHH